jgi:hypothetical protein
LSLYGRIGEITATNLLFGADFRLSDAPFQPTSNFIGDYIQCAADDERFSVAWTDTRSGNADIRFTSIPVPDRFATPQISQAGVQLSLTTNPIGLYTIQASADLDTWTTLTNFRATDFSFQMLHRVVPTNASTFYRASSH